MPDPVGWKLYAASEGDRVSRVSSLLRDHPEINVNWTNEDEWASLHVASNKDHVEVVNLLLKRPNINVNLNYEYGQTPFLLGCWNGHVSVVEVLLKDPRVDITLDDDWGCTPLWWASHNGKHEVIELLIASSRDLGDVKRKKGADWGRSVDRIHPPWNFYEGPED